MNLAVMPCISVSVLIYLYLFAGVAKLVDALDSKSGRVFPVSVRVRPPVKTES